jgi:hypothetical protein
MHAHCGQCYLLQPSSFSDKPRNPVCRYEKANTCRFDCQGVAAAFRSEKHEELVISRAKRLLLQYCQHGMVEDL